MATPSNLLTENATTEERKQFNAKRYFPQNDNECCNLVEQKMTQLQYHFRTQPYRKVIAQFREEASYFLAVQSQGHHGQTIKQWRSIREHLHNPADIELYAKVERHFCLLDRN